MANHNERITVQYVSSLVDVQEKIRVWVNRATHNGFKETSTENQAVLKRRSKQVYVAVILGPIIGFFYGTIMYGAFAGIIHALVFGVLGLCGIPLAKSTVVKTSWNNELPFHVDVDASGNNKSDYENVIDDLRYVLSTDPGTSIQ